MLVSRVDEELRSELPSTRLIPQLKHEIDKVLSLSCFGDARARLGMEESVCLAEPCDEVGAPYGLLRAPRKVEIAEVRPPSRGPPE